MSFARYIVRSGMAVRITCTTILAHCLRTGQRMSPPSQWPYTVILRIPGFVPLPDPGSLRPALVKGTTREASRGLSAMPDATSWCRSQSLRRGKRSTPGWRNNAASASETGCAARARRSGNGWCAIWPPCARVCGGDKLDHGSGGFSCRGRSKTLPPVAFDLFGDGRREDVHRGSLLTSSACLSC
jgi:hypothetical protein